MASRLRRLRGVPLPTNGNGMKDGIGPGSFRERLGGPFLRAMRHFWPNDRFLWPGARLLLAPRAAHAADGQFTTADGLRMRLTLKEYPDGSMYFGVYEVATVRLLRRLVRPGDAVI